MNQIACLSELFGAKAPLKLLTFFLENPSAKFSQKELRQKVKLAKATATKWMNFLEKQNFIEVERVGVTKLCSLSRKNPIIKQLKKLENLLSLVKLKEITSEHNVIVCLYGSAARGEDVEDSDIDILMLGKIKKEQIIQEINKLSEKIGRKIKIEIFTEQEWSQMAKKDPAFYERVEKDKVEL